MPTSQLPSTSYLPKGLLAYEEALALQQSIRAAILAKKQTGQDTHQDNTLILCEHPSLITYGSSAKETDLFLPREQLHTVGLAIYEIKRGGAITYHGPGQIVGYPVLDLEHFKTDVRWYISSIAAVIIRTLADYGIDSYYDTAYPGVWIEDKEQGIKKKICAIGVHLSRWVSNHGFAFNVCNTMHHYQYFVPCGIQESDRAVTTLQKELNREVDLGEVQTRLLLHFAAIFQTEVVTATKEQTS